MGLILFFIPFLLTAGVTTYLWLTPKYQEVFLNHTSYYFVLALCFTAGAWYLFHFKKAKVKPRRLLRMHWKKVLVSFFLTIVVFLTVETGYKVLSDETNLVAVSKSMVTERTVKNHTMGKYYYHEFHPIRYVSEKRPYLFPFLASVLHTFTGYRVENLFILNYFILFCLILLVYALAQARFGNWGAWGVCLVALAQPVLTLCASSAGFETLALFLTVLSLVQLYFTLKKPSSLNVISFFMTLSLLCHTRYEGSLFALLLGMGAFQIRGEVFRAFRKYARVVMWLPLFWIPLFVQRILKSDSFENKGTHAFGLDHLWEHFQTFARLQFKFDFELPYAVIPNLLGWACLVATLFYLVRKKGRFSFPAGVFWSGLGVFFFGTCLYLSFHFGIYDHPTAFRIYLITAMALGLYPFVFVGFIDDTRKNGALPYGIFAYGMLAFLLYHPIASKQTLMDSLILARKTKFIEEYLKAHADSRTILIVDRPGQYTVRNFSALDFPTARNSREQLEQELRQGLFSKLVVFQDFHYPKGAPDTGQEWEGMPMKEFRRVQISATEYLRILESSPVQEWPSVKEEPRGLGTIEPSVSQPKASPRRSPKGR